jgi:non-specific protein-tyrosine kinase
LITPKYEATAQLFVSANDIGDLASSLQQGAQFSQDRVQSYADIIDSPHITGPVAARLNVGLTAKQISDEISADAPLNTVLVNVHVTDPSAKRAQLIANAVSAQFATYAAELEATAGKSAPPVKVTVVKEAPLPTSPVSPKVAFNLAIGLVVGLALGVGGAIFRESLDNTVKTTEDVQDATGRTAIGVIAFDPDAKDHPLVVIDDLHGTRAEAFRQLRTNLQFVDVDSPLRSIVCTSSVPGEGKTTTICNLAITLAHTGMRVLLLEADLRRPRVGHYLGVDNAVGLTSVLIGAVGFDDAVQHWGRDGLLDVLPSGPTPPNPSELLGSRGMADLLHSLEGRYDIVVLDAPPLLPVTDAAVLAVETSGALLVVHHGTTRREQLENSAQALASVGARILGTVINFAPRKGPESYYYGYAYSYRPAEKTSAPPLRPTNRAKTADAHSPKSKPPTREMADGPKTWPHAPALPDAAPHRASPSSAPVGTIPMTSAADEKPAPSPDVTPRPSSASGTESVAPRTVEDSLVPYSPHRSDSDRRPPGDGR